MMGEVTPLIAATFASAPAPKILLPLTQVRVDVVGLTHEPLPHLIEKVTERLKGFIKYV